LIRDTESDKQREESIRAGYCQLNITAIKITFIYPIKI